MYQVTEEFESEYKNFDSVSENETPWRALRLGLHEDGVAEKVGLEQSMIRDKQLKRRKSKSREETILDRLSEYRLGDGLRSTLRRAQGVEAESDVKEVEGSKDRRTSDFLANKGYAMKR